MDWLWTIWTQFEKKKLSIFVYLTNEPSSSLSLGSTIKKVKLKHNNVLLNKLRNTRLYLNNSNIICLYVYTCIEIYLYTNLRFDFINL